MCDNQRLRFQSPNNLTFLPIISDIIVVKVFSTNTDISFMKKNLSYSGLVFFLHPKLKQCLGVCSQGRKTIENSWKDFSAYEMFIAKVFTEDKLSFVPWLLQTSVWFSWALTNGFKIVWGLHDTIVHIKMILTVEFPPCQYARGM